jgi:histone-lysine N-methyltransferase SETMAR
VHEISAELGISYGTCQAILTEDLNMRRVSAKFVPRVLITEQKEHRLSVATNLPQKAESDQNFMEGIITGGDTWIYGYNPETKRQSSQWKPPDSPRPKKARQVRSKVKVTLNFFLHGRDFSL